MKAKPEGACCTACGSVEIVLNGHNASGHQQFHCKRCGVWRVLEPAEPAISEERKEEILRAAQERMSLRGIERVFGVARQTVARWIEKKSGRSAPTA